MNRVYLLFFFVLIGMFVYIKKYLILFFLFLVIGICSAVRAPGCDANCKVSSDLVRCCQYFYRQKYAACFSGQAECYS